MHVCKSLTVSTIDHISQNHLDAQGLDGVSTNAPNISKVHPKIPLHIQAKEEDEVT
jgi:hypothetical protein